MRRGVALTVAAAATTALAVLHALFGLSNFGLAADDDETLSVPLGEGILAFVAAISLAGAAAWLARRRVRRASLIALAGTAPLPIFFAFTVPEHSGWQFLFASLVTPFVSGATALACRRRDRERADA